MEQLVPGGSPFHGIHGMRFDQDDNLYVVSVIGQSVFRVDTETGDIETVIPPPLGMGDDIAIAADGTLVWTAIEDGIVYAKSPNAPVRRLMEDMRGVNGVTFSLDGERLFVSVVFYGDALYELDITGAEPPRLISENHGGLNAFQMHTDGMLYGPLVFGGRVVRVDPDSGEMTTVSDDFRMPGALKLHNGEAYVLEEGSELKRVNLETGQTTAFATLPSGADNLAFNSEGRLFVTLSEVNAIVEVDIETGSSTYIVEPSTFNSVTGLAVITGSEGDRIYLGDLFGGVRIVNARTGSIEDTPVDIFQPAHISVTDDHLVVVSEVFGDIQLLDRSDFSLIRVWHDFNSPGDALEAPNGDIIVAETGSGRLLRVTGSELTDRQVVVDGLDAPAGLAWAGGNDVYVTETGGGRLLRVDLASGAVKPVATDLAQPEGVATGLDNQPLVMEVAARRLTRIDSVDGSKIVIADELPVGLSNGPSLYRGVAVSPSAIYINSDVDNTIYRLKQSEEPQSP